MPDVVNLPGQGGGGGAAFSTKSLLFDGIDDYVKAPLDGTSTGGILAAADADINLTISLWVKIDTSAATKGIFQWANALNSQFPFILIQQNSLEFRVYVDSGYRTAVSFSLDTWYNIVVTRNSSTNIWTGYLNGSSFFTYDDSGSLISRGNATDIYLGNGYNGYVDGNVDEVSIFNSVKAIGDLWDGSGKPTDLTGESGIVAWYRMGENATFKEPQILMPEQNNKDKVSNFSMEFDGTDDYVDCGNDSSLHNPNFTISVWVRPGTITGSACVLQNGHGLWDSAIWGFRIRRYWGNYYFYIGDGTTYYTLSWSGALADTWQHIVMTYDGTDAKTYLNAVLKTTLAVPNISYGSSIHDQFQIGRQATNIEPFLGNIDEVSLFSSALNISEIEDVYNSGVPTDLTSESGLVSWWRMGEEAIFDSAATEWAIPDQAGSNDGVSANMDIYTRVGDAPNSPNNALSYNMDAAAIVEDTPPNP